MQIASDFGISFEDNRGRKPLPKGLFAYHEEIMEWLPGGLKSSAVFGADRCLSIKQSILFQGIHLFPQLFQKYIRGS